MKKECEYCGKTFEAKTNRIYCDNLCQEEGWRIKKKIKNIQNYKKIKGRKKTERYKTQRRKWAKKTGYMKKYMKQWRQKNHQHWIEWNRNNYHKNRQKELERMKKYRQTESYKLSARKKKARRKRQLAFIPLWLNPFPKEIPIQYHHITNMFVIPLPKKNT